MPAYAIVLVEVTDRQRYAEYTKATPAVVAQFGGKFIARAGQTVTMEGPEEKRRVVLIEFPSLEMAQAFYGSEEYKQVKELRKGAANGTFILVDGYAPSP